MNETAYILNTASDKSLVIMDEVGRGTGTNDGLSIAWAVSEELLNRVKCRTFFATHYHELSLLAHPRIVNRSMEVLEKDGGIIFLRKLREGPTAESYGIHVARLAGLSASVLDRADQIMQRIKDREQGTGNRGQITGSREQGTGSSEEPANYVNLQDNRVNIAVLKEIRMLDPDKITPLEALGLVNEWKARLAGYLPEKLANGDTAETPPVSPPAMNKKSPNNKDADKTLSLFD